MALPNSKRVLTLVASKDTIRWFISLTEATVRVLVAPILEPLRVIDSVIVTVKLAEVIVEAIYGSSS
jgi:hypothetical protein